ncbi:cyclin-box carrying protein isoform [Capsaspora owczarzaki ATCC 30864]|uniref:Cyclin-box carrying protein isoform n=1 Tax=Capsaspora owczarzaki (strain ATCC 30864) TaxID=595528 RepID=A0A0D2VJ58_CAPO3|nr:cyclin-box carrying protein isoform [Capsaspora owczarzaki ATCC 30864]KJE90012.1 cyclin-box carrying protein isoform [Capsaspora owczarzaki ATCC 30864]|eukprot:XP_004349916.2 cyclin-box carrying protein isoform [Capsaspora owczarzaki ATCC 30864]
MGSCLAKPMDGGSSSSNDPYAARSIHQQHKATEVASTAAASTSPASQRPEMLQVDVESPRDGTGTERRRAGSKLLSRMPSLSGAKLTKSRQDAPASAAGSGQDPSQSSQTDTAAPSVDDLVQHISEREPDNSNRRESLFLAAVNQSAADPSPLSYSNSKRKKKANSVVITDTKTKFNSTSTFFVDATVSQPDLDETFKCVALAIYYCMEAGHKVETPHFVDIFDEKKHPLAKGTNFDHYDKLMASEEKIYQFIKTLFVSAALTAECAIITLVYVERLIMSANLTIHATNWKRITLGAVLLACKVWDDQAVWNVDFCTIFPDVTVEDFNKLEKYYITQIMFNVSVPASVYTKYYLDLRSLAEDTNRTFTLKPLTQEQAEKMEAMSMAKEREAKNLPLRKRAKSCELYEPKSAMAILS